MPNVCRDHNNFHFTQVNNHFTVSPFPKNGCVALLSLRVMSPTSLEIDLKTVQNPQGCLTSAGTITTSIIPKSIIISLSLLSRRYPNSQFPRLRYHRLLFRKWLCRLVKFKGREPHISLEIDLKTVQTPQRCLTSAGTITTSIIPKSIIISLSLLCRRHPNSHFPRPEGRRLLSMTQGGFPPLSGGLLSMTEGALPLVPGVRRLIASLSPDAHHVLRPPGGA